MSEPTAADSRSWRRLVAVGAALAAVSVLAGAFGAHGLKEHLDSTALGQWQTAARYLMYAGLGTILCGLLGRSRVAQQVPRAGLAGICVALGGAIFFLSVGALALGGPRLLGAVAPIGGLGMMAGFGLLALMALQTPRDG